MKSPPYRRNFRNSQDVSDELSRQVLLKVTAGTKSYSRKRNKEDRDIDSDAWSTHSSELVRWLFVRHESHYGLGSSDREMVVQLISRALEEAEAEEVVWTPLLDVLVEQRYWAARVDNYAATYEAYKNGELKLAPIDQAEKLAGWVKEQKKPESFLELMSFSAGEIKEVIGRHATCLDVDTIEQLLKDGPEKRAIAILENENVSGPEKEAAYLWLARGMAGDRETYGVPSSSATALYRLAASPTGLPEEVRGVLIRNGRYSRNSEQLRIVATDRAITNEAIDELVRNEHMNVRAELLANPNLPKDRIKDAVPSDSPQLMRATIESLARRPQVPDAAIQYIYTLQGVGNETLASLLRENTNIKLLRLLAQTPGDPETLMAIANIPAARKDPGIREILLSSRSPRVAGEFIRGATAEEFPRLLRMLGNYDAEAAVDALDYMPEGTKLSKKDVESIFKAGGDLALRAFQKLPSLKQKKRSR